MNAIKRVWRRMRPRATVLQPVDWDAVLLEAQREHYPLTAAALDIDTQ